MTQEKCKHSAIIGQWELDYHDYDGNPEYTWVEKEISYCVDIDLHRYRCTKCNKVMYYSQAARKFYEEGIESPYIKGLSK